ncbi:MAG: hypothetical protein ACK42Z_03215 [Candidatus Kapaibacteriota bacterium]
MKTLKMLFIYTFLLLFITTACKEKSSLENEMDHTEAIGVVVYHNEKPYFKVVNTLIDTTIAKEFLVPLNEERYFEVKFIDAEGYEETPTDSSKNFSWVVDDATLIEAQLLANEKFKFKIRGLKSGKTLIEFRLNHYDHPDFKTPKVPLVVK